MTNVGEVYCAICWDYYNRHIFQNYGKLASKDLFEFLRQRRSGGASGVKLFTAEHRKQVQQSGALFCPICFSYNVLRVTEGNQPAILADLGNPVLPAYLGNHVPLPPHE